MINGPTLFMSPSCGACKSQKKILNDYFISIGQTSIIPMVNVDKYPNKFKFVKVLPTWLFPIANGKCIIKTGVLKPNEIFDKKSGFGEIKKNVYPGINDLQVYGKDFPNGKGFTTTDSYYKTVENVWGKGSDALNAGVGGTRSLGPDNIKQMYNSDYLNDIRMAHPADQLGSALYLNRTCNKTPALTQSGGLVSNSSSGPQIVDNTSGFGNKRRNQFGNFLNNQMGPYKSGSHFLINEDKFKLYSGARQNVPPRPNKVVGDTYISQAPEYKGNKEYTVNFGKNKR